jgi:hypothetical protein
MTHRLCATLALITLLLVMAADPADARGSRRRAAAQADPNPRPAVNATRIFGFLATRAEDRPTRDLRFFRQIAYNSGG